MKQNRKQIEANLRNKICAQYTSKIDSLKNRIEMLEARNQELRHKLSDAEHAKDIAEEKVKQLEDWVNRLQEFMDMNDDDRKSYVENLKKTNELDSLLQKFSFYDKMIHSMFT